MIDIIGTNIISSLGFTTEENFNAVKQGISGVKHYDVGTFDLPEAFMASLIDRKKLNEEFYRHCGLDPQSPKTGDSDVSFGFSSHQNDNYTSLEKAAILSVFTANKEAQIDLSSKKTIFILSTTKGNVDLIGNVGALHATPLQAHLWHSAKLIAQFFQNPNTPIVVSNACISGAAAQIAAMRELESENYDNAVVVGVDFLSKFIISGFQSFKALSPELCKPFDKDRCGLNLGEAAATLIFHNKEQRTKNKGIGVQLIAGAIRNDATHISAPSRTGEGSYRALKNILRHCGRSVSVVPERSRRQAELLDPQSPEKQEIPAFAGMTTNDIAFINAHGTSTPYNDAMEVQAITRAGLENVPVNSLKAIFGHTLGAAGVVESIISIKALEENLVLKSMNFDEQDFDNQINIQKCDMRQNDMRQSDMRYVICDNPICDKYLTVRNRKSQISNLKSQIPNMFIKMMSGFGGVNAALLFCDIRQNDLRQYDMRYATKKITNHKSEIGNLFIANRISLSFKNSEEITEFYRSLQIDYPKFFKMDTLSKLGFLASEMIFSEICDCPICDMRCAKNHKSQISNRTIEPREDIAVICFNRSSSLDIDTQYQATIQNNENYYPSPSLFVYTLPNIVTGEIAIRNKFYGETSFYILENYDEEEIFRITRNTLADSNLTSALVGWIEGLEVKMFLVKKS